MRRTYRNIARNYYATSDANGKRYYIIVGDTHIEVERVVYEAYSASIRKEMYFEEQYDNILVPLIETATLSAISAEEESLHRISLQLLEVALSELEKSELRFLLLYYVLGKTLQEIADTLGVHFTTIDYRHKSILRKLKNSFLKNGGSSDI